MHVDYSLYFEIRHILLKLEFFNNLKKKSNWTYQRMFVLARVLALFYTGSNNIIIIINFIGVKLIIFYKENIHIYNIQSNYERNMDSKWARYKRDSRNHARYLPKLH